MRRLIALTIALATATASISAQSQTATPGYQLPPKEIVDILDAAPPPTTDLSPTRDTLALIERASMPVLSELAQPMLRLGGRRINPRTNGPHRAQLSRAVTLKSIADGSERKVTVPANAALTWIGFSTDGKRFAFTHQRDNGIELWLGDSATGQAKAVTPAALNASLGTPCDFVGDGSTLLCRFVPQSRGAAPAPPTVPPGPNIQENRSRTAPVRTYQDLLTSAYDEALFDHYATSQLAFVDAVSGQRTPIGSPAVFEMAEASPDTNYVLISRIKRPYSWLVPYTNFPSVIEVLDRKGAVVTQIADLPMADTVPNNGVLPGPRSVQWQPLVPATVVWAEALDNGDPKNQVPHRDRIMTTAAPFSAAPTEVTKTEYRFGGLSFTDSGAALVTENDRTRRWTRTWIIDKPGAAPRKLWDRSQQDSYANPGSPQQRQRASGTSILQSGNSIFLSGAGASPEGARPFVDRLDLTTLKTERLFQTSGRTYETVLAVLTDDGSKILTRYESREVPPNVYVRDVKTGERRAMTNYQDPAPQLKGVQKQLVTYKRNDGVELSATIITPPGWTPAQGALPTLLWAYPREFTDPTMASQVTGSSDRYTSISGASHFLFLTQGYAIIDDPTMPIVGPGETANDTYIEQLVASAQAAVDRAVQLGVTDRNRVVVGGHSYGGFMTANLLAHSDIFRAGLARSGAYNRTLTPFGFQNEQRTFWEVPEIYGKMSPFYHAHKINEPILLVHGEMDDNSGTFPIQSERLYMALKGHGATVRYVTLPYEAHGYAARESVLHTVAEMLNWANEFGKNAKPRTTSTSQQ